MPSLLATLWRTSRPRFWPYLAGPFLLGWTANADPARLGPLPIAWALLGLAYFTLPANLFLYGTNDLHDEDTDALNAKKNGYETRVDDGTRPLVRVGTGCAVAAGGVFLMMATASHGPAAALLLCLGFGGFFLLGWQYSAPPLRAKARPFLDSLTNVLYVFPALVGYALGNAGRAWPPLAPFAAGACWCVAMHAFSAVPDIDADRAAAIETVATRLGQRRTLLMCGAAYLLAGAIAFPRLGYAGLAGAIGYAALMGAAWRRLGSAQGLQRLYQVFPYVNAAIGFGLWAWILVA